MQSHPDAARYRVNIVGAFQLALLMFILTALIGLANALRIFGTLDRNTLLTHLHSGTLGWITMGVIGLALWIYGGAEKAQPGDGRMRTMVLLSGAITALYILAFWSGNFQLRAVSGTAMLAVVLGWWMWVFRRASAIGFGKLDVPRLALVLALTTLTIGSTIGVIVQVIFASGRPVSTVGEMVGAHASAQVGGYLVLAAIAVGEWRLRKDGGARSMWGVAQCWLLFISGLAYTIGSFDTLFGGAPAAGLPLQLLGTVFQLVGMIVFVVRNGRAALRTSWSAGTGARHFAISVPFLVLGLILFVTLISLIGQNAGDFTKIPPGIIHALDHTMFIGVMTNVIFGSIRELTQARPRVWPWADHVIFWGMNLGAAGFIATLLFVGSHTAPVAYTASTMGVAVLLGIATYLMRLQSAPVHPA